MPIDITPCYQKDYLRPLKVKIEDGISRRAWLIRPGESEDTYIPPLTKDQLKYLNEFFQEEGALGICQKENSLYVAFENESAYERSALGLSDYVRSDENTSVQIPAPDEKNSEFEPETFMDITGKFLWGSMSAEEYLSRFADPSPDSTIAISTALLKMLPGRSQTNPVGQEYQELYIRNILVLLDSFPINDSYGWTMLANAYLHADEAKGAIVAARWAAALNPTDLNNLYILGSALYKYYEAYSGERRGALKEALRAFGKLVEIATGLYGRMGDVYDLEKSLARWANDDILGTHLQTLRKILEAAKTDDPEGSEGGNTEPDTSTNTSSAPAGPSSTPAPDNDSSTSSTTPAEHAMSEWNTSTSLGSFDIREEEPPPISTTLPWRSAAIFHRRRKAHRGATSIDTMSRSAAPAAGFPFPAGNMATQVTGAATFTWLPALP